MKFEFKGFGADRKKVIILAGLGVVLAYFVYSNLIAPSDDTPSGRKPAASAVAARTGAANTVFGTPVADTRRSSPRSSSSPARPEFKMGSRESRPDPTVIDPTLRLDLLAKVQSVNLEGGERNLFQFGPVPLPKTPEPKIVPNPAGGGPAAAAQNAPPEAPVKPPPPPIPLKFYGYSSQSQQGDKRAFFLDGDEIIVATEGQMIKSRYKVVRIGINSVVVEDVQFQHQQTLPLEEQTG
jgi:hypothetical protein